MRDAYRECGQAMAELDSALRQAFPLGGRGNMACSVVMEAVSLREPLRRLSAMSSDRLLRIRLGDERCDGFMSLAMRLQAMALRAAEVPSGAEHLFFRTCAAASLSGLFGLDDYARRPDLNDPETIKDFGRTMQALGDCMKGFRKLRAPDPCEDLGMSYALYMYCRSVMPRSVEMHGMLMKEGAAAGLCPAAHGREGRAVWKL